MRFGDISTRDVPCLSTQNTTRKVVGFLDLPASCIWTMYVFSSRTCIVSVRSTVPYTRVSRTDSIFRRPACPASGCRLCLQIWPSDNCARHVLSHDTRSISCPQTVHPGVSVFFAPKQIYVHLYVHRKTWVYDHLKSKLRAPADFLSPNRLFFGFPFAGLRSLPAPSAPWLDSALSVVVVEAPPSAA